MKTCSGAVPTNEQAMTAITRSYIGRFAPSPTGPLHLGSLVAAMASYLDARAHHGRWLIRIEDVDTARSVAGAADQIIAMLAVVGMHSDVPIIVQSTRSPAYQQAFDQLYQHVYPCGCTRKELADSHARVGTDGGLIYPGTCRQGLAPGSATRAWRLRVPDNGDAADTIKFNDRLLGPLSEQLVMPVGDFVLKRADGFWAYQLAVVVDDAAQGVTDVVRGADLLESTARQIYLQRLLALPTPRYLHVPVVTDTAGEKLSKQTGATALDLQMPLRTLMHALALLDLAIPDVDSLDRFWAEATAAWAQRYGN